MNVAECTDVMSADTLTAVGHAWCVDGTPLSYELRFDDTLTLLLLAGFVVTTVALGYTKRFVLWQLKNFFHVQRNDAGRVSQSSVEFRCQLLLLLHTCLQLSVLLYICTIDGSNLSLSPEARHKMLAFFAVAIVGYFAARFLIYTIVNSVFFDARGNREWLRSLLFVSATEGVLISPLVLVSVYLDLSVAAATNSVITVLALVKMLLAIKCYSIFFRQRAGFLQFFLYLCALEAVPLFLAWLGLAAIGNNVILNYW